MGLYQIEKCIFTGRTVQNIQSALDGIEYIVTVNNKNFEMTLPYAANEWETNEPFFKENKYLFHALLLNDKWLDKSVKFITIDVLKQLIAQNEIPKTPKQKVEHLFMQLYEMQKEDGQWVKYDLPRSWQSWYFKSQKQAEFYIQHLHTQKLVHFDAGNYLITYAGLEYAIKLETEGSKSKKCFVAMSFNENTEPIRDAIKVALKSTDYEAIIIDEQIIDSARTINDEIIASLKKCKFCIADFTNHSKGVYFESGFALGQGKKVIYTCSEEEFKNAHFDIRPLQHIVYKTTEQLTKDLINKIEAYIN